MKKLSNAFTLAEVLITLTIIGIIASVTLPSLNNNVQLNAIGTQLSKFNSQIQNGIKIFMAQNEVARLNSSNFNPETFVANSLNVRQVCQKNSYDNCFADNYRSIDNSTTKTKNDLLDKDSLAFILEDGATFQLYYAPYKAATGTDEGEDVTTETKRFASSDFSIKDKLARSNNLEVLLDVNGKKGPNIIGYDLHLVNVNPDGTFGTSIAQAFDKDHDKTVEENLEKCIKGTEIGGCWEHLARNNFRIDYP